MSPPRATGRVTLAAKRYGVWLPIIGTLLAGQTFLVRSIVRAELAEARRNRERTAIRRELYVRDQAEQDRRILELEQMVKALDSRLDSAEKEAARAPR